MRVAGRFLFGGFLALTAACGSDATTEPGVLTITLNGPPPSLTNTASLQITGQVVRTPPAPGSSIVVSATGGASGASDTAAVDGTFALTVGLAANVQNNLSITATDGAGSAVTPVGLSVTHDNLPPRVASMAPAHESDNVTSATVSIQFDEAVVPGSAVMAVAHQGVSVPGTSVLSTDSMTLTFTPTAPFAANGIHRVTVSGARDQLGNALSPVLQCFVTGGTGITVFDEPTNDWIVDGSPAAALVPIDLVQLRLSRTGSAIMGVLRFTQVRSLNPAANNTAFVILDLDVDQNGGTGFKSLKDSIFVGVLGTHPSSGAGVEHVIGLASGLGLPGDSSFAGTYFQDLQFQPTYLFMPGLCGPLIGFEVPLAAIGNDDGSFDVVGYLDALDPAGNGVYLDPAPDNGVFSASLTAAGAATRQPAVVARPSSRTFRYPLRFSRTR